MLDIKFNQFDTDTQEGMLLLASIAVLTGDIDTSKYGPNKTPDEVFEHIQDLANKVFFEQQYKSEKKRQRIERKRNKVISKILK